MNASYEQEIFVDFHILIFALRLEWSDNSLYVFRSCCSCESYTSPVLAFFCSKVSSYIQTKQWKLYIKTNQGLTWFLSKLYLRSWSGGLRNIIRPQSLTTWKQSLCTFWKILLFLSSQQWWTITVKAMKILSNSLLEPAWVKTSCC